MKPFEEDPDGMFTDAGDVGGDIQVSDSFMRRWTWGGIPDEAEVVDVYVYLAEDGDGTFVQAMWVWTWCTDPSDPGGSEINSDIRYMTLNEPDLDAERACMNLHEGDLEYFLDLIGKE